MINKKTEPRSFWLELAELREQMINANDLTWTLAHALDCGHATSESFVKSALAIFEYQDTLLGEMEKIIDAMIEVCNAEKVSA